MKNVAIIGMGLSEGTLTPEAWEAIGEADVLLGAERMLALAGGFGSRSYPCYLPEDAAALIQKEDAQNFAVLVSGDIGFYSAAAGLREALSGYNLRFVPGISTLSAFFARLGLSWQDAALVSVHGRNRNVADTIRRNRLTFCLTGNNLNEIGKALCRAGFGQIKTYVGENLGTRDERVYDIMAGQLSEGDFPSLTVLLFENERPDDRTPCGLPEDTFLRLEGIPMTKSEVRAVVSSKLHLHPGSICWDVGAGTGSVTVEAALSAYRGHVYAIEQKEAAVSLIEQNCAAFRLGNVTALCSKAPEALADLPAPDAVFIGGSGGKLREIIQVILQKNPNARIVVTAVTIETVSVALSALQDAGLEPETVQISVAKGRKAGNSHLMEAQNPVTILSAGGLQ